jgi:hypothetical protein
MTRKVFARRSQMDRDSVGQKGYLIAAPTPFTEVDALNDSALSSVLRLYCDQGVHGRAGQRNHRRMKHPGAVTLQPLSTRQPLRGADEEADPPGLEWHVRPAGTETRNVAPNPRNEAGLFTDETRPTSAAGVVDDRILPQ